MARSQIQVHGMGGNWPCGLVMGEEASDLVIVTVGKFWLFLSNPVILWFAKI